MMRNKISLGLVTSLVAIGVLSTVFIPVIGWIALLVSAGPASAYCLLKFRNRGVEMKNA